VSLYEGRTHDEEVRVHARRRQLLSEMARTHGKNSRDYLIAVDDSEAVARVARARKAIDQDAKARGKS
jgi:hypothetical protein